MGLRSHTGENTYVLNCLNEGKAKLYGALEAYTKEAMRSYHDGTNKCLTQLKWHGWGEDMYMQRCLSLLGVQGFSDYELVGDTNCMWTPCSSIEKAAFHPYKDTDSYLKCWHKSRKIEDMHNGIGIE